MTIIDAPWGAGKTYFLQELIKYNINSKIKMNMFKKIIMIDVWKYAYSNNIPFQLLSEIYTKLVLINKTKKDSLVKIFKKIANITLIPLFNSITKFDIDSFETKINYFEELKEINDKKDLLIPTIIIFDNVERLNNQTWEVIKLISLLSSLDNLLFILPMNYNNLNSNSIDQNEKESNNPTNNKEVSIEKFIDINSYVFKQDYKGLLENKLNIDYKLSNDELDILDNLLSTVIDNKLLTIRQLEKKINTWINNEKNLNFFQIIKIFVDRIWGANLILYEIVYNEMIDFKNKLKDFVLNKSKFFISNEKVIDHSKNYLNFK